MARIRHLDDPDELAYGSALELDWIGRPPTQAPVVRVRDVLLVPASDVDGDWATDRPVDRAVDLGRGLSLGSLDHDEVELIFNACTPRGHYFIPVRQFNALYAFVLEVDDLAAYAEHPYAWDRQATIITAMQLSRLIRDNAYSMEFAARVVDYDDGQQQVIPQGQHHHRFLPIYRFRNDRDWLTTPEAEELRALLEAYWQHVSTLPPQVNIAISLSEGAIHVPTLSRALVTLFMGLEALLNSGKHQVTKQMTKRLPLLAAELGIGGVSGRFARRMYGDRSSPAHGQELVLPEASSTDQAGQAAAIDHGYLAKLVLLQNVLRAATRRAIEDPAFAASFADAASIRARWPVYTRVGVFRRKVAL